MPQPIKTAAGIALALLLPAPACAAPRPAEKPFLAADLISSSQLPAGKPIMTPNPKTDTELVGEYDVPTARYVTRLVRRDSLSPGERARINESSIDTHNGSFPRPESFVVTELVLIFGEKDAHECRPSPATLPSIKFN